MSRRARAATKAYENGSEPCRKRIGQQKTTRGSRKMSEATGPAGKDRQPRRTEQQVDQDNGERPYRGKNKTGKDHEHVLKNDGYGRDGYWYGNKGARSCESDAQRPHLRLQRVGVGMIHRAGW